MPEQKLYSAADLAKWTGLSRQAVNKAGRVGPLKPSKVGRRYDISHPAAVTWLEDRGVDVEALDAVTGSPRSSAEIAQELGPSAELDLDAVNRMTLAQLTDRWGSAPEFLVWTKARKELGLARRQERLLAALDGKLIPRAVVNVLRVHLDVLTSMLVRHAAKTIAAQAAGGTLSREELERLVAERVLDHVRATKHAMQKTLAAHDPAAPIPAAPPVGGGPPPGLAAGKRALKAARKALLERAAPAVVDLISKQARLDPAPPAEDLARRAGVIIGGVLDRVERQWADDHR